MLFIYLFIYLLEQMFLSRNKFVRENLLVYQEAKVYSSVNISKTSVNSRHRWTLQGFLA